MIRVLIADDFPQIIEVMENLIARASDMEVVEVVTNFQEVLDSVLNVEYEVILMNDYLSPTNSAIASRRLRQLGVEAPTLIMSMERNAELIRDSLAAGANGFILKEEFFLHLLPAIRAVCDGERYLSPAATAVLMELE